MSNEFDNQILNFELREADCRLWEFGHGTSRCFKVGGVGSSKGSSWTIFCDCHDE